MRVPHSRLQFVDGWIAAPRPQPLPVAAPFRQQTHPWKPGRPLSLSSASTSFLHAKTEPSGCSRSDECPKETVTRESPHFSPFRILAQMPANELRALRPVHSG